MLRESSIRWTWVGALAAIGYALPVAVCFAPGATHIPFGLARVIVPILNYTAQVPVDPDWPMVTLFMAPVNAIVYGLIGLAISQALLSRAKPANRAG
jgi:hypothetical protein